GRVDGGPEEGGRDGKVVDPIAGEAAFVLDAVEARAERGEAFAAVEIGHAVEQRSGKRVPRASVDRPARELLDTVLRERAVVVVGRRLAPDADDRGPPR